MLHEANVGYYDLQNTRISKNRDILNSTLGIYNPLEYSIGGLAALMPTIDIVTQRNSGGIGNAWDFWDIQRVWSASDRWSLVTSAIPCRRASSTGASISKGEFMARTNGDLDYDNWVLFFTGHGASGGGSDLDQGDTRRNFFGAGLRRCSSRTTGGSGGGSPSTPGSATTSSATSPSATAASATTTCRTWPRSWAWSPASRCLAIARSSSPDFTPLSIGLSVAPGTPIDLSQIHEAKYDSTIKGDFNNVAPRIGFAWQPSFAPKVVVRGGWGIYYERTGASYKRDLQLSAPYFFYQNVPSPENMADPYPRLNVNPFEIPLRVQIVRDANGAPTLGAGRRHAVPCHVAVHREEQHLHRSAAAHAVSPAVDDERAVRSAARGCWSTWATSDRAAPGCSAKSTSPSRSIRV